MHNPVIYDVTELHDMGMNDEWVFYYTLAHPGKYTNYWVGTKDSVRLLFFSLELEERFLLYRDEFLIVLEDGEAKMAPHLYFSEKEKEEAINSHPYELVIAEKVNDEDIRFAYVHPDKVEEHLGVKVVKPEPLTQEQRDELIRRLRLRQQQSPNP